MEIVKKIIVFITKEVLGFNWLNDLIGKFISLFGKDFAQSRFGLSLQFLIYDFIKISFLLFILIFLISYIQSYFPPERTKKILSRFKGIKANIFGALLGTLTPFCACSSIPLFIGFTRAKISPGVTFSFLISSPLVDLGALILLISVFGIKIAIAYVIVGLVLAVIGGTIIEKTKSGELIEDFVKEGEDIDIELEKMSKHDRLIYAKEQALSTYKKVFIYILIGVAIGSIIHNWIPYEWIDTILGLDKFYSVPLATLIGTPLYADIFGTIPIAEALYLKGVGVGTILAFMMSVTTLSVPSLVMLRRAVKPKLLIIFMTIVISGIIIIGYLFNFLHFLF